MRTPIVAGIVLVLSYSHVLAHSLSTPSDIVVSALEGGPIESVSFVVNSSPSDLGFEMTSSSSFFSISRDSSRTPAVVTVIFDPNASDDRGKKSGSIRISMPQLLPDFNLSDSVRIDLIVSRPSGPPEIRMGQDRLSFSGFAAGPPPLAATLNIVNGGGQTLTYAISTEYPDGQAAGWLAVAPQEGSVGDGVSSHAVAVNSAGLPPGEYAATIVVSGNTTNSPQTTAVRLVLFESPLLVPEPFEVDLSAFAGSQAGAKTSFSIENVGGGSLEYLLTPDAPWLRVTPLQAFALAGRPVEHTVIVDPAGLAAGSYTGRIAIQPLDPIAPSDAVLVFLTVNDPTRIQVSPGGLELEGVAGSRPTVERLLSVASDQSGLLRWSARSRHASPWLEVSGGGTTPGLVRLRARAEGLTPGVFTDEIVFSTEALDGSGSQVFDDVLRVPVRFSVSEAAAAGIRLSERSMLFSSSAGAGSAKRRISIDGAFGKPGIAWEITGDLPAWLRANAARGTTPFSLELTADSAGLTPGVYQGVVSVSGGSDRLELAAAFVVRDSLQSGLSLAPEGLAFEAAPSSARPGVQRLWATNRGAAAEDWRAFVTTSDDSDWLLLSPASGRIEPGESAVISVGVNGEGLDVGDYSGLVRVETSDGVSQFTTIALRALAPESATTIQLSPPGVVLQAGANAASAALASIAVSSNQDVSFQAGAGTYSGSWLTAWPPTGRVEAGGRVNLTVSADASKLGAGEHRGVVVVSVEGGLTKAVPVLLIVTPAIASQQGSGECGIAGALVNLNSPAPDFRVRTGDPVTVEAEARNGCGDPVREAALSLEFSNRDSPVALGAVGGGRFVGTWTPTLQGGHIAAFVRTADSADVSATGTVTQGVRPWIAPGGIVNGADFAPRRTIAPGGILSLFGARLTTSPDDAEATPLPAELAGTRVLVNGSATPLFAVRDSQINLQAPYEAKVGSMVEFIVESAGRYSTPAVVAVVASQPALFELPASIDGPDRAVAINQDGTLNESGNPAPAGSVVTVFLTGQGPLTRSVATGVAAPGAPPFAEAALETSAIVGGLAAEVLFAGLTPGFVGLMQANLRLGAVAAPDADAELAVKIGDQSAASLRIAVSP